MSPMTTALGYRLGKGGHKGPLQRDIVIRNSAIARAWHKDCPQSLINLGHLYAI